MADHTNKEYAPVDVCRELSKAIKDQIAEYERELADLQERELRKNSAEMIERGDASPNDMSLSEMEAAKNVRTGKSVVKQMCKSCGKAHEIGKCMNKGEDFIDLKNQGDREKRLKGIGHETPNPVPGKGKQVTPKRHAEGGNDGTAIESEKPLGKATVPMAKPPSGGTGLAPKAPSMAKPAAPAAGMPKPPMIAKAGMSDSARMHNSTGSSLPRAPKNSTGSVQPMGDSELPMTKGGARMDNPKVEHGKPSLNTMAKAAIPGARPGPGTMQGDAMSASARAAPAAPAAPVKKPIVLPGRAQAFANWTPAGQFATAGASLPGAGKFQGGMYQGKKPILLPGKGKPQVSSVNPAAAHLSAPPAAIRPPAAAPAPVAKPVAPAPASAPGIRKSESPLGSCALCGNLEHPGNC